MITLSWMMLLSGVAALAPGAVILDDPAPPADQVVEINLFDPARGWIIRFFADGRVHAQYGSTPGDGASLPKGTVKFDALLTAVQRLKVQREVKGGTQVSLVAKGQESADSIFVSDDNLFRYLIASFQDKWQPETERFQKLLKSHPIYPKERNR